MKKSRTGTVMNRSFSWKRTREYRLLQWLEREVPRRSQRVLPRATLRYEQLCGAPTVTSPPA